jgi:hypothetical protein
MKCEGKPKNAGKKRTRVRLIVPPVFNVCPARDVGADRAAIERGRAMP